MKIAESNVVLQAKHSAESRTEFQVSTRLRFGEVLAEKEREAAVRAQARVRDMLVGLLEAILAALEGRKCRSVVADCRDGDALPAESSRRERRVDWQREISQSRSESESTMVSANGSVRTADGRCIAFSLGLLMERSHRSSSVANEAGSYVLRDPLVVNFAGGACDLAGERMDFDLDADGKAESLPGLGGASAYLVIDLNGNGYADDGGELFGTQSGDGFADLRQYDADGNGWIDEADPVFARLSLWKGGQDGLRQLADEGVGALCLASVDSPFSVRDGANALLGEIRASGVWLSEDGRAGSLQHVDLATS